MAASSNPSSDTLPYGTLIHMLTIKLSSTNYLLWRSQIYPLLIGQGLISLVDGSRPAPPTDVVDDENSTPNPAHQSWRVDDQRLVSLIFSSLSEEAMSVVDNFSPSRKEVARSLNLDEISNSFAINYLQLGDPLIKQTKSIYLFMKGLGSNFSNFSATQMAMSPIPSFSNLLNNAEVWDMFQQTLEPNMSSPAAFTAHTYSRSSNNQMTTGHYANVCPNRFNREIATTTHVANIAKAFSASSIASDPPISNWYLDTGASGHMTPTPAQLHSSTSYTGSDSVVHRGNQHILAQGNRRDVLYVLDDTKSALVAVRKPKASFELWHSRLGHLPNVDSAPQPSSCNLCDEPPLLSGLQSHTNQDEPTINTHELPAIPHETQSQPNQEEPDINDQHVNESSLDPTIEPALQIEMNPLVPPPIEMNPIVHLPRVSSTHHMQTGSRAGIIKPKYISNYACTRLFQALITVITPRGIKSALKRPELVDALKQELPSMALKDSWDLIPRPKDVNVAKYARDILQRASLEESKHVSTPFVAGCQLSTDGQPFEDPTLYRSLVGSLQYLTITRPDLSFPVNLVSQHLQHPTIAHFQAVETQFVSLDLQVADIFTKLSIALCLNFSETSYALDLIRRLA
ncbi:hypothetical protein SASPL_134999 [Salvia splendens]|uniref:Uncharacterized protein n=1 Tax=Salvia splendens TaxID=180675 RepID=A0A8X8WXC9_SALSN|nr:hypothetical protein SASPL_134999 [Salvia splendens]